MKSKNESATTSSKMITLGNLQFKTILTIIFIYVSSRIIQISADYDVISKTSGQISLPLLLILSIYYISREFTKYRESVKEKLEDIAKKINYLEQNGGQNG